MLEQAKIWNKKAPLHQKKLKSKTICLRKSPHCWPGSSISLFEWKCSKVSVNNFHIITTFNETDWLVWSPVCQDVMTMVMGFRLAQDKYKGLTRCRRSRIRDIKASLDPIFWWRLSTIARPNPTATMPTQVN